MLCVASWGTDEVLHLLQPLGLYQTEISPMMRWAVWEQRMYWMNVHT